MEMNIAIKMGSLYRLIICSLFCLSMIYADPPNWQDNPGGYEFTSVINTIIMHSGNQVGVEGDMFAAFDENDNVRGLGIQLIPSFGPNADLVYWEITARSNVVSEILTFKYYSSVEDKIYTIIENYEFDPNGVLGDAINPTVFNTKYIELNFANPTSTSIDIEYETSTEIAGFQFAISGVNVSDADGGDSEGAGFSINSNNNIIIGFSLSGTVIEKGSGVLLTIKFDSSDQNQIIELFDVVFSGPGGFSISTNSPIQTPFLFNFNQSMNQAFYYFVNVTINQSDISYNDWVGAFKNNICVGKRKWDTSLCNNNICEIPLMGDDGSELTDGYLQTGDVPSFKIFDASENQYYDAIPSEDIEWANFGNFMIESLNATIPIPGCMDINACNYNPEATQDDGSCAELDECGICNGTNIDCPNILTCSCVGCDDEDACNYSSFALWPDNSCYYAQENKDCTGACIATGNNLDEDGLDCQGECGGSSILDGCGICNGDNSTCKDCAGILNGDNVLDNCGTCDANESNDCIKGCDGVWGSGLENDSCQICGGDNTTCKDCNNVINGTAYIDGCSNCVGGNTGNAACSVDCANLENGTSFFDNCGICVSAGDISCVQGCDGLWKNDNSEIENDLCGICGGDNSTCTDCNNIINGDGIIDNCGECVSAGDTSCIQGCDGVWASGKVFDQCGVCDGNGCHEQDCTTFPAIDYDCIGTCMASGTGLDENGFDCLGNCNGIYMPSYICANDSYACTPSECDLDDLDIELLLLPSEFGINKVYPNPFNPITNINYKVSLISLVKLNIYDISGRKIANLLNEYRHPGSYTLSWNAANNASGVYIVEIISQSNNSVKRDLKKILYLK
jgi:hypothetical protein